MKPKKLQIIPPKKSDSKKAANEAANLKKPTRNIKRKLNEFGDSDAL